MESVIVLTRPTGKDEFSDFLSTGFFNKISNGVDFLECKNNDVELIILNRSLKNEISQNDLNEKHKEFIEKKIKASKKIALLWHDYEVNNIFIEPFKLCKIPYSSVADGSEIKLLIKPNIEAYDDGETSTRDIKIIFNKFYFKSIDDLKKLQVLIFGLCTQTDKLETALNFLHECLPITTTDKAKEIANAFSDAGLKKALNSSLQAWVNKPEKDTLTLLRDKALTWAGVE